MSPRPQVPLGSVTPLAVANPSAKDVVLLLDANIQKQAPDSTLFVHPLVNTQSLGLTPAALDAALRSVGAHTHTAGTTTTAVDQVAFRPSATEVSSVRVASCPCPQGRGPRAHIRGL